MIAPYTSYQTKNELVPGLTKSLASDPSNVTVLTCKYLSPTYNSLETTKRTKQSVWLNTPREAMQNSVVIKIEAIF